MSTGPEGVRFLQAWGVVWDREQPDSRKRTRRPHQRGAGGSLMRAFNGRNDGRDTSYSWPVHLVARSPRLAGVSSLVRARGKRRWRCGFFPIEPPSTAIDTLGLLLLRFLTMQPANGSRRGLVLRPQPDRGDEFVAAIIARPGVADAAFEIKLGLFGHKQHTPAVRAVGSAEIFSRGAERGFLCATGRLDGHRRSSSTHPPPVPDFTR